jgi:hypothetical protein
MRKPSEPTSSAFPSASYLDTGWQGSRFRLLTQAFLERAWKDIADAASRANVAVVLGTERRGR